MKCFMADSSEKELNEKEDEGDPRPPPKPGERGCKRPGLNENAEQNKENEQHERGKLDWLVNRAADGHQERVDVQAPALRPARGAACLLMAC
eukprot:8694274-Alexandrium_andersonii.AAC.1